MLNTKPRKNTPQDLSGKPFSLQNNQLPEPMALKMLRAGFRIGGRLLPNAAGRLAYKLWFTPTRFKMPSREKEALESAKIETHEIDNNTIVTFSWGMDKTNQPLILLMHGWSGRGTQLGSFVQPLLDAGYRVLSFDAPAHGKSSGKQTNLYKIADVIISLQKHYGEIDAAVTHSFGGPCIAVALQKGFVTNRIVSISPPATTRGLVEKFNHALHVPERAAKRMIKLIETKYGESIWEDISMVNTIKSIALPGLIIHDSDDDDVPCYEGQAVAQAWGNAQFIKTSNLGHRRILRDPDVIKTSVAFIQNKKSIEI